MDDGDDDNNNNNTNNNITTNEIENDDIRISGLSKSEQIRTTYLGAERTDWNLHTDEYLPPLNPGE